MIKKKTKRTPNSHENAGRVQSNMYEMRERDREREWAHGLHRETCLLNILPHQIFFGIIIIVEILMISAL